MPGRDGLGRREETTMTLACRFCGELWTTDSFHTEVRARLAGAYWEDLPEETRHWGVRGTEQAYQQLYAKVVHEFTAIGCRALGVYEAPCTDTSTSRDDLDEVGLIYDLLGSDLDEAAAMLEDMGLIR